MVQPQKSNIPSHPIIREAHISIRWLQKLFFSKQKIQLFRSQ